MFISLFTAGLILSSVFALPLPFSVSVLSFQTVFINLAALCLKRKDALLCVLLYLFMGAVGLPVFSGGTAGIGKLLSPVGGYYFGFAAAVFLMSSFKGKAPDFKRYLAVTILLGIPAEHIFATLFMSIITSTSLWASFTAVSLPFIVGDVIKAVASCVIAVPLNKALIKIK